MRRGPVAVPIIAHIASAGNSVCLGAGKTRVGQSGLTITNPTFLTGEPITEIASVANASRLVGHGASEAGVGDSRVDAALLALKPHPSQTIVKQTDVKAGAVL